MNEFALAVRKFIALAPARFALSIFYGCLTAIVLDLVHKALGQPLLNVSWLHWIGLGTSAIALIRWKLGYASMDDAVYEQLTILDDLAKRGDISPMEKRQLYRRIAGRYADSIYLGERAASSTLQDVMTDETVAVRKPSSQ
jgi:hypothetical protein